MDTLKIYDIDEFETAVQKWAVDRNLYAESNPRDQCKKTIEEVSELEDAIFNGDLEGVKDAIGDILVTLVNVGFYYNLDLLECSAHAYNEIKNRKGKMVNGKFVKEEA